MTKPKLSFTDLLAKFKEKKITNGSFSDGEIIEYLRTRSYYYKISSYRKNFPKLPQGGYENLTFDHLVYTAKLDVRLREFLLNLCLDVEHATRTRVMTALTDNTDEDGYKIIEDFQDEFPDKFTEILKHFRHNKYKQDMFKKRTHLSIWVFMEIIDYGTLVQFLENFLKERLPEDRTLFYPYQHRYIKNIRNACAHNDVFLINLFDKTDYISRPDPATKSFSDNIGINKGLVHYPKIIDIINLFYVHSKICSKELNNRRHLEGKEIINFYNENQDCFKLSTPITKFFNSILKKSIDFLSK